MTNKQIEELCTKYKIAKYKEVQIWKYLSVEPEALSGFLLTIDYWRKKYDQVGIEIREEYWYGDDIPRAMFCLVAHNKLSKDELIERIEIAQKREWEETATEKEIEDRAMKDLIVKLKKKYPEEFTNE